MQANRCNSIPPVQECKGIIQEVDALSRPSQSNRAKKPTAERITETYVGGLPSRCSVGGTGEFSGTYRFNFNEKMTCEKGPDVRFKFRFKIWLSGSKFAIRTPSINKNRRNLNRLRRLQRRGRDSNSRYGLSRKQHFQCCAFSHSATSPDLQPGILFGGENLLHTRAA